jgi:hypothetical protein
MYIGFNSNPNRTTNLSHLTASHHKNTHSLQNNQKTQETTIIMVTSVRHSPVALKASKIALRHTIYNNLRNMVMQILYVQLTFLFIFSSIILCVVAQHARGLMVSLYCYYWCFFLAAVSERSAPTKAVSRLFFAAVWLFYVLLRCDFRQGGGHSHWLSGFGSGEREREREREREHKRTW